MSVCIGSLDADGIMIRAAAFLGRSHGERGYPRIRWFTEARQRAYNDAYQAASDPKP